MRRAIGGIDDFLIEEAEEETVKKRARISWAKWGSVAAALILVAALGVSLWPGTFGNGSPETQDTSAAGGNDGADSSVYENKFDNYTYQVDEGRYAAYIKGRVIADRYVGCKLEDVTVTAGWVGTDGRMLSEEHAKAEIFAIDGVSAEVAVAIRFIDELEAQLTTCYYVIMNPTADLTPVREYVIEHGAAELYDGGLIDES